MRPRRTLRTPRPVHAAAGALMLIVPTSAAALAAGQADAQSAIQIDVNSGHVGFGHHVTVTGSAPAQAAGQTLRLEFARAGAARWQPLASTKIGGDGHFRFVTPLHRSGRLRAVPSGGPPAPRSVTPVPGGTGTTGGAPPALAPSASRPVVVASKLTLRQRSIAALDGQAVHVGGHLLPAVPGRSVRLEGRSRGRWQLLGTDRTGGGGGFDIRYRPGMTGPGGQTLRVRFRGDRLNARSLHGAGRVTTFTESLASWYDDAGSTGCGFHAGLGVANKSLPCGTKVTFRYGGRTVTATVDDRGPYVGGREWDLNQNTAGALGFGGVGTVWSTS
jgi:rare lipoprotein A